MQIGKSIKDGNKLLEKGGYKILPPPLIVYILMFLYNEKVVAKRLGALWEPIHKKWYITEEIDIEKFKLWLPK